MSLTMLNIDIVNVNHDILAGPRDIKWIKSHSLYAGDGGRETIKMDAHILLYNFSFLLYTLRRVGTRNLKLES